MKPGMDPWPTVIQAAVAAGKQSPCAKSKRGAVVFHPQTGHVFGEGFNGQPADGVCTNDAFCREACAKLCVHAEDRAIQRATRAIVSRVRWCDLDILHVKVVDGKLVESREPSCWQCSRKVRDVGLGGFWLYREGESGDTPGRPPPRWQRYTAAEFHRITLVNSGLVPRSTP